MTWQHRPTIPQLAHSHGSEGPILGTAWNAGNDEGKRRILRVTHKVLNSVYAGHRDGFPSGAGYRHGRGHWFKSDTARQLGGEIGCGVPEVSITELRGRLRTATGSPMSGDVNFASGWEEGFS